MKLRNFGRIFVLAGVLTSFAHADPLIFYFTTPGDGAPGHTITGEIDGLSEGTGGATDIIIFSDPGNGLVAPVPFDLAANGYFFTNNSFTVTGGVITAADALWYKETAPYTGTLDDQFYFDAFGSGNGERNQLPGGITNTNDDGFSGTTYGTKPFSIPSTSAVPEPSQWGVFLFLAVAGCVAVKRFLLRRPRMA